MEIGQRGVVPNMADALRWQRIGTELHLSVREEGVDDSNPGQTGSGGCSVYLTSTGIKLRSGTLVILGAWKSDDFS